MLPIAFSQNQVKISISVTHYKQLDHTVFITCTGKVHYIFRIQNSNHKIHTHSHFCNLPHCMYPLTAVAITNEQTVFN